MQGKVTFPNKDLDDLVLLRSDGNPTYMLAVVVDDHDMGVTHIIRGDDHLTNAARQTQIYQGLGWDVPVMAHIPLIHGPDGAKLSKRHGALGVDAYRAMGYLPAALRNYLARLGWSHGDKEFFTTEELIAAFDLSAVGRSPSRFDYAKLENVNGHYMRAASDAELFDALIATLPYLPGGPEIAAKLDEHKRAQLARRDSGLEGARQDAGRTPRRRRLPVRRQGRLRWMRRPRRFSLAPAVSILRTCCRAWLRFKTGRAAGTEAVVRAYADEEGAKLGVVAQPLRAALTGRSTSPGIFDVLVVLGARRASGGSRIRRGNTGSVPSRLQRRPTGSLGIQQMNNPPRDHHFVPQFWIKRFASSDGKIWAYNWNNDRVRDRSAKALMQIFNLYTVQPDGADDTTLETVDLGEVDRKGNAAFDRVLNGDHDEAAKGELATFISAQIMRDPETIVSYNPKAQELTLSLLEAFDAPNSPTFARKWAENFPGAKMEEEEYDHIRSLGLKGVEDALEQIISALDASGGLPELPFTDLIRCHDGRSVLRNYLLRFSWSLKTDTNAGFVLGDMGVLYQREALTDGLKLPLSRSAALYLVPAANPALGIGSMPARRPEVDALNLESATRPGDG